MNTTIFVSNRLFNYQYTLEIQPTEQIVHFPRRFNGIIPTLEACISTWTFCLRIKIDGGDIVGEGRGPKNLAAFKTVKGHVIQL